MLIWLGLCALAAFVMAAATAAGAVSPAPIFALSPSSPKAAAALSPAAVHIAFAFGALPLIFGAIAHFVPVLTKSRLPAPLIQSLPCVVQAAGLLAVFGLMGALPPWSLHLAASCDAVAALLLLFWLTRRLRQSLGAPHPGAHWYGAALLCLFLAVSLVPLWLAMPVLRPALRLFHLHLNTLGVIGLAALGTLPVLFPTALQQPEPTATARLRSDLFWALAGVVLIAAGAAVGFWLAVPGAALCAVVIGRDLVAWGRAHGKKIFAPGAAPLFAATLGLLLVLASGIAHGAGWTAARPALAAYLSLFLLPLVTGALSQLTPVWRHPGADTPLRQAMQRRLIAGGRLRAALFFLAGAGWLVDAPLAGLLALIALSDFALRLLLALYNSRHA